MLEQAIIDIAEKIRKKNPHLAKTPYELYVKPELPQDVKGRDRIAIIKAGNPPIIFISQVYIAACFSHTNVGINHIHLKDTLFRCIEFLPKMYHTLSLIPIASAIALRKDSRKWAKSLVPGLRTDVNESAFEITNISVTVRDTVTDTSVTRNGLDYKELIRSCYKGLSKLVLETEEQEEYREMMIEIERAKEKEIKPNEVGITIGEGSISTNMEY